MARAAAISIPVSPVRPFRAGHVHSYERTNPMLNYTSNPCGTTHILIGAYLPAPQSSACVQTTHETVVQLAHCNVHGHIGCQAVFARSLRL